MAGLSFYILLIGFAAIFVVPTIITIQEARENKKKEPPAQYKKPKRRS